MAILSNQKRGAGTSRYNHKDNVQQLSAWIEGIRDTTSDDPDTDSIFVHGFIDRTQFNRIRAACGMEPVEFEKPAVKKPAPVCCKLNCAISYPHSHTEDES